MITEDQLEQLAIQWQETLPPALSRGEKEEDGRLAEVRRRDATPGRVLHVVTKQGFRKELGEPMNKERRYPIALTMRGPWGSGLPRFMGIPWARRIGVRRSLGMRWATCKGCLQVRLERNQKP